MKQQILYIHGGAAFSDYEKFLDFLRTKELNPYEEKPQRWTDWLWSQLEDTHEVLRPSMPNSQNAQYAEWKIWFERHFQFLHDEVTLLGWSQGGYFLTKYLSEEQFPKRIKALHLIAAPFKPDDFCGEDGGDFQFNPDNLSNVAAQVSALHIYHSEDDFVVPYTHGLLYRDAFPDATFTSFTDRNHFIIEKFPEIAAALRSL